MARPAPKPESQPAPYLPGELEADDSSSHERIAEVAASYTDPDRFEKYEALREPVDEADENAAEDSSIVEYDAEPAEASLIEDVATVLIEMMQAAAASANAGTYAEWALKVIAVVRKAAPAQPGDPR